MIRLFVLGFVIGFVLGFVVLYVLAKSKENTNKSEFYAELASNRGKFIDWVLNKHPEFVDEYLGEENEK